MFMDIFAVMHPVLQPGATVDLLPVLFWCCTFLRYTRNVSQLDSHLLGVSAANVTH